MSTNKKGIRREHKETGGLEVSRMPLGMSVSRPQRRRQKDQSLERLSCSPSVVDFVTQGAQRGREHFRPPAHPLQPETKALLLFSGCERGTQHE